MELKDITVEGLQRWLDKTVRDIVFREEAENNILQLSDKYRIRIDCYETPEGIELPGVVHTVSNGIVHINLEYKDFDIGKWYYVEQPFSTFVSHRDLVDEFYTFSILFHHTIKKLE